MSKFLAVIASFLVLCACSREAPGPASTDINQINSMAELNAEYGCTRAISNPTMVTIGQLLADPPRFEGRPVRFEGFYYSDFEHTAIYPDAHDGPDFRTQHGLWLLEGLPERYVGKRVTVEGIFTSRLNGHIGQWPATICNERGFAPR